MVLSKNALPLGAAAAGLLVLGSPSPAAPYDFVPAPQNDLNRIYRVDRATGEVISCQYGLQEGTVGATLCFAAGEGAGPQAPAEYGLVPSRHEREGGVFRVNYRTVVCTPQTSPAPGALQPGGRPSQTGSSPATQR